MSHRFLSKVGSDQALRARVKLETHTGRGKPKTVMVVSGISSRPCHQGPGGGTVTQVAGAGAGAVLW